MAAPPDPELAPEAWDGLRLGPKLSLAPGIVTDLRVSRSQRLDVQSRAGANGATIAAQGYEPAKVTIELTLWTARHRKLAAQLLEVLVPKLQKSKPEAIAVYHPTLAMHGIKSLIVQSVEGPSLPKAEGIQTMSLECVEYFPPPKAAKSKTTKVTSLAGQVPTYVATNDSPAGPPSPPSAVKPQP